MSPDPARTFGRTPLQTARGALLLALIGGAIVFALSRYFARPDTPLGVAFHATGLPPQTPAVLGGLLALAGAGWAWTQASRTAERFRLDADGLRVEGWSGSYLLAWGNIAEAAVTDGGSLGVRVHSREAVLATHAGTEKQREWFRTQEPFGAWDYLYTRSDLGLPAETVCGWLTVRLAEDR